MNFIEAIKARAKSNKQTIVLPESFERRTLEATEKILAEEIANVVLVGNKEAILKEAEGLNIDGAEFVDPAACSEMDNYVETLVELRKHKGMTAESAKELLTTNALTLGVMMVKICHAR